MSGEAWAFLLGMFSGAILFWVGFIMGAWVQRRSEGRQ